MVSKEQNLGGRAYVVDSLKEIRPKSSNIISRLNGSINSVVQNNNQHQDQIIKNFSLLIEGDTTIGYRIADDGKTIINETTLKAVVTYRRGIGAMQVASIPDDAFKWVSFDTNKVVATGSTAVLSTPSTYIVSVDTEFLLSSVEPSQTNTIQLKLNTSVSIQYGTISLYTYSDAETRDELLLSLDNLRWYTNPYDIERDAKFIWRKDSSDGGKTWLYFRMEYEGPQGPPGTGGEGGTGSLIVEYQYSDSDREAPLKYIPFIFGGSRVNFKGGSIGDMNDEDWMANPPKKGKYKWMRVSTDGGKTWTYSVVTGPEPSFFEIESSKDEFRQNERGVVDKEDTLKFWVIRRNIPNESKTNWVVTPSSLLPNQALIHDDEIIINVPVGFKDDSFTVSASIGMYSEVLSKTITGVAQGTSTPKKLRTIDRSLEPPEPFPTTLEDGLSPIEDGDYLLVKIAYTDESSKERETALIPYRYYADIDQSTGLPMGWRPSDNSGENHSEIMANCLQEVLAGPQTVPSFSAYYGFFQSLVANDAFIKFLGTQYLHITDNGAIYGGGYDRDGINKDSLRGFHISSDGKLQSTDGYLENAFLNDVQIISKGSNGNTILETIPTDKEVPINLTNGRKAYRAPYACTNEDSNGHFGYYNGRKVFWNEHDGSRFLKQNFNSNVSKQITIPKGVKSFFINIHASYNNTQSTLSMTARLILKKNGSIIFNETKSVSKQYNSYLACRFPIDISESGIYDLTLSTSYNITPETEDFTATINKAVESFTGKVEEVSSNAIYFADSRELLKNVYRYCNYDELGIKNEDGSPLQFSPDIYYGYETYSNKIYSHFIDIIKKDYGEIPLKESTLTVNGKSYNITNVKIFRLSDSVNYFNNSERVYIDKGVSEYYELNGILGFDTSPGIAVAGIHPLQGASIGNIQDRFNAGYLNSLISNNVKTENIDTNKIILGNKEIYVDSDGTVKARTVTKQGDTQ